VLIARLACELHCYIPEELDEAWAQLRHLGRRRAQLITAATASVQRLRDFLSVAWPVAAEACAHPFESVTWLASVQVVTSRCGGQPEKLAAVGLAEFTAAVRGALAGWGGQRVAGQVCRAVFAALTDTEGVIITHRRGLLRRCAGELGDLQRVRAQLRETEADMAAVLGELGLARLGDIPGLTAVGAAAVLAETGDPCRYDSSSSLVKHAGLSPAENASGAFEGQAHISRRGRPGLRLAVWRAVWPLLIHNPVMAAKYAAMTAAADAAQASSAGGSRQASAAAAARARRAKARVACAASLLRWIYSMVVHGTGWDPDVASGAASCQRAPRYQAEAA
jgi:transposase